jgi:hypothetical protein
VGSLGVERTLLGVLLDCRCTVTLNEGKIGWYCIDWTGRGRVGENVKAVVLLTDVNAATPSAKIRPTVLTIDSRYGVIPALRISTISSLELVQHEPCISTE